MSRELPSRPDLDHLKKQAKALLPELQRRNPHARLADAQHAVAREYGFTTWAALKARVRTLAGDAAEETPVNFAFNRYTPRARQALFFSRFEASARGQTTIDPAHLLVGLIRSATGASGQLFERAALNVDAARHALPGPSATPDKTPDNVLIPFGLEAKRALIAALEESRRLGHDRVGVGHLVLGILSDEESPAADLLKERGVETDRVRSDAAAMLSEET